MSTVAEEAERGAVDTRCRRRGYSLRGQPVGGRCPECWLGVADSLIDGILGGCDPAVIGGRARALRVAFWGSLAYAALGPVESLVRVPSTATVAEVVHRCLLFVGVEVAVAAVLGVAHWSPSDVPAGRPTGRSASGRRAATRWAYRIGVGTVLVGTLAG